MANKVKEVIWRSKIMNAEVKLNKGSLSQEEAQDIKKYFEKKYFNALKKWAKKPQSIRLEKNRKLLAEYLWAANALL